MYYRQADSKHPHAAVDKHGCTTSESSAIEANRPLPPEGRRGEAQLSQFKHDNGCLVCGAPLVYYTTAHEKNCHFCGKDLSANACCEKGHFVCDHCHSGDAMELIEHLCMNTTQSDPASLLREIRRHPCIPMHGPEHHSLVPGVLLACLRAAGHPVAPEQLRTAIRRGLDVTGGSCGFIGVCGAAAGVGIAFSVLLEATPLKATARQRVQQIVQRVLADIAGYEAARCCQRDSWIALRKGMRIAKELFSLDLPTVQPFACGQTEKNKECLGSACPLWL